MPVKGWIEVDELYCKGCDLCVNACPQDVISLNMERLTSKGCTGCAICAIVCPEAALTIYREVPARRARVSA
jgi:2-oxoglutarate ferredoxin oxidoreductase subunit delta